jgi:hypothetical protein
MLPVLVHVDCKDTVYQYQELAALLLVQYKGPQNGHNSPDKKMKNTTKVYGTYFEI